MIGSHTLDEAQIKAFAVQFVPKSISMQSIEDLRLPLTGQEVVAVS